MHVNATEGMFHSCVGDKFITSRPWAFEKSRWQGGSQLPRWLPNRGRAGTAQHSVHNCGCIMDDITCQLCLRITRCSARDKDNWREHMGQDELACQC
jgi:hypothetical protein